TRDQGERRPFRKPFWRRQEGCCAVVCGSSVVADRCRNTPPGDRRGEVQRRPFQSDRWHRRVPECFALGKNEVAVLSSAVLRRPTRQPTSSPQFSSDFFTSAMN